MARRSDPSPRESERVGDALDPTGLLQRTISGRGSTGERSEEGLSEERVAAGQSEVETEEGPRTLRDGRRVRVTDQASIAVSGGESSPQAVASEVVVGMLACSSVETEGRYVGVGVRIHRDGVAVAVHPLEDRQGHRVLDAPLNHALQGASAKSRIEPLAREDQ